MRRQTFTVMVLYSGLFPKYELTPIRCINCSRMLCKIQGNILWVTNSAGVPLQSLSPSIAYIEKQCHSCKALYKLLFQASP
jgi:phage FluMu protein Com